MISEQDLLQAIAECQGEREPNASTCMKLAAYYTIYNQLYSKSETVIQEKPEVIAPYAMHSYSYAPAQISERPTISYSGDTEFAQAINGKPVEDVMIVIDELMSALWALYPRVYNDVMQRLGK